MKKNLLFLSLFCTLTISVNSQTINSSNMPSIGEEYSYFQDTLQYNPGSSGSGVTWDFSNVTFPPTLEYEYYVNPANTINSSNFPAATIAEGQAIDTNYTYFMLNSNEYTALGNVSGTQLQTYTDPMTYATLPISFGNTNSDNFTGTVNTQIGNLNITGNLTGDADATGIVTLPGAGGTFKALRYKVIINQTITIPALGSFVNKTTQYLWFNPLSKNVIFQLSKDSSVTNIIGQPTTTDLSYSVRQKEGMVLTGSKEFSLPQSIEIFPNPSFGKARVIYSAKQNELITINVFDVSGKLIQNINETASGSSSNIEIETNNWEKGIYFVQITQDKHQVTKKLIVR